MLYDRPSFAQLSTRIAADLATLPAVLREPLTAAWARSCHGLHGHLDWVDLQTTPLACELERLYDWAALYAVDRLAATAATGPALATGVVGAPLLAGSVGRAANGLDYVVVAAVMMGAGGTGAVTLRCLSAGAEGNLDAGAQLTLTSAAPGVSSTLVVGAGGLGGGSSEEAEDDWRARVVDEWQTMVRYGARGGKPSDYVYWAKSAHPSVTGALVQLHTLGMGSVVVRPICNGLPDRLPSEAVMAAVRSHLATVAPFGDVRVVLPLVRAVVASIDLVASVDSAATRNAISASLATLVNSEMANGSALILAEVDAAVASVTTQYTRIAPTADVVCEPGEVMVLQPVVFP